MLHSIGLHGLKMPLPASIASGRPAYQGIDTHGTLACARPLLFPFDHKRI